MYRLTPGFLGTDGRNAHEYSDCLAVNLARVSNPCARCARVCAKGSPVGVSEMLCRRVLLAVCMLCLHEHENMFAGYCDALRCVRYAFVAAPALHAMPCMTVKDVWSVTVREHYVVPTWHVCAFAC